MNPSPTKTETALPVRRGKAGGASDRAARQLSLAEKIEQRAVKVRQASWKLSVPDEPGLRTDLVGARRQARRWRKLMDVVMALEAGVAAHEAASGEVIYLGGTAA